MFAQSEVEKRLLYLAVLNTSNLVEWQTIARPSKLTMEKTFHDMMKIVQWVRFAEYKLARIVAFPQYIISKDTEDLLSIQAWVKALYDIRDKLDRKELDRDKNAALLQRELEIKRELNVANSVGSAFTPNLAKWALDLCDITPRHPDYNRWMKVMCVKTNEAWIIELSDFMELREMLHDNLPFLEENPQAISVIHQINLLIKECRKGFTDLTFFGNESKSEVEDFEILEDGSESKRLIKINRHTQNVPTDMPIPSQYDNRFKYLQAKAKWEIAQQQKQMEEKLKLDKSIGAEDV
jgi:hypothetical protein